MAAIATSISFDASFDWSAAAAAARDWAASQQLELRDAIVLLPFAQLLAPARRAWAQAGGWLPRIETTQTLAASLAPPPAVAAGEISFDVPTDRLTGARLLQGQGWAKAWRSRDPGLFEQAVVSLVELAHAMARAAAGVAPAERASFWQQGRSVLVPGEGPGQSESLIARVAWEWAASAPAPATDRLFQLRPSSWIGVRVGGADRLVESLLRQSDVPTLLLDADLPLATPFDALAAQAALDLIVCDDFEDEAQRSAARVLHHLQQARTPVALIAQDRSLVRRVRALLERQQVPLLDETGWRLSTTRAGARLMSLLRTLSAQATADDLLDWLKAGADDRDRAFATQLLEQRLRRAGRARLPAVDAADFSGPAEKLWAEIGRLRGGFAAGRARSLLGWCQALRAALLDGGDAASLEGDAAGALLLDVLHLRGDGIDGEAWLDNARVLPMNFAEFSAWVDSTLEQSTFIPDAPPSALVVITPLARAMLRPFAAVVLPGVDDKPLGAGGLTLPLLGDAQLEALGLDSQRARRDAELLGFAQLLRLPQVSLLRRQRDGSEPLAASPLLERLLLAMRRTGRAPPPAVDDRRPLAIPARPTPRPLPTAPALLPARLSASAIETLRACPYRFFALQMLGLREQDELDEALEKRDYGNWLHAVLYRFHVERPHPRDLAADRLALQQAADAVQAEMAIDSAEFLPYAVAFERLLPHYLHWLQRRDADGARWRDGEAEFTAMPAELAGTALFGRIDRIDDLRHRAIELIDYKTGDVESLKRNLKQPTEDTQLAFYAALVSRQEPALDLPIVASYLGLDSSSEVVRVVHPEVLASARVMLEGLGRDLARLRAGAPMPALGEGKVCEHCAARGLCRRDDWASPPETAAR